MTTQAVMLINIVKNDSDRCEYISLRSCVDRVQTLHSELVQLTPVRDLIILKLRHQDLRIRI